MCDRDLNKSLDTLFPQECPDRCRVCAEPVVDGRWNYCSERCRDIAQAVQRMFLWSSVREKVLNRDDYTCQQCGLSYEMAKRASLQIRERIEDLTEPLHHHRGDHPAADYDRWRRAEQELRERYGEVNYSDGLFQVDHIQPLAEGGHPFDERNLQTLCADCHQQKTAAQNRTDAPDESTETDEQPDITLEDYLNA